MLKRAVHNADDDWEEKLPEVLMAYRSTPHMATNKSPFMLEHGQQMRLPNQTIMSDIAQTNKNEEQNNLAFKLASLRSLWRKTQKQIEHAATKNKEAHDERNHAGATQITRGTRVWLQDRGARAGPSYKLVRDWIGPFTVEAMGSRGTCTVRRVDLPYEKAFTVNLNKLRPCREQIQGNAVWDGRQWYYADDDYNSLPISLPAAEQKHSPENTKESQEQNTRREYANSTQTETNKTNKTKQQRKHEKWPQHIDDDPNIAHPKPASNKPPL